METISPAAKRRVRSRRRGVTFDDLADRAAIRSNLPDRDYAFHLAMRLAKRFRRATDGIVKRYLARLDRDRRRNRVRAAGVPFVF